MSTDISRYVAYVCSAYVKDYVINTKANISFDLYYFEGTAYFYFFLYFLVG